MSTFHDIGIPVQHLASMQTGLNRYFQYFGRDLAEQTTHLEPFVTSQLQYYFGLMARMFGARILLDPNHPGQYLMSGPIHPYVYKALADALGGNEPDHGVVSGLCLFRSVERAFMSERNDNYNLNLDQFSEYNRLVVEQDVTRAALAIALHNMKPDRYPKLFPIAFADFPLTYLLLMADELQEFYRLEGVRPLGVIPLPDLPLVESGYDPVDDRLNIEVTYTYKQPTPDVWAAIKLNAEQFAKGKNDPPYKSHRDLVARLWERATDTLRSKLVFGDDTSLRLRVRVLYKRKGHTSEVGSFDSDDPD
jgi:hypothetical protein